MKTIGSVRRIPIADKQLLADLKRIVLERVPDAEMILYGSAARGTRRPDSDYDVLVLLNAPLDREFERALRNELYDLEVERGVVCTIFFETRAEWETPLSRATPFYRNVQKEAVIF